MTTETAPASLSFVTDPSLAYDQRIQAINSLGQARETAYKIGPAGKRTLVFSKFIPQPQFGQAAAVTGATSSTGTAVPARTGGILSSTRNKVIAAIALYFAYKKFVK